MQVSQGNEIAFTELVNDYSGILFTVVYRYLGSKELAEEVVQDILIRVWQSRETLAEIRNFRTYMYVLCRNYAINALKKLLYEQKQLKRHIKEASPENESSSDTETGLNLIDKAIETLSPHQRRAWELSRRHSKTYQEVASEMDISRETVKTHIQRANEAIIKYVTMHMDLWLLILLSKKIF